LQSIPRRYFFELLSHFSTDSMEKEKCLELSTAEGMAPNTHLLFFCTLDILSTVLFYEVFFILGQQDLYEYCNRPRRHILEVLYDFR
jgi:hypothetical protein